MIIVIFMIMMINLIISDFDHFFVIKEIQEKPVNHATYLMTTNDQFLYSSLII